MDSSIGETCFNLKLAKRYFSFQTPLKPFVILSFRPFFLSSFCPYVLLSFSHFILLSFKHFDSLSSCHIVFFYLMPFRLFVHMFFCACVLSKHYYLYNFCLCACSCTNPFAESLEYNTFCMTKHELILDMDVVQHNRCNASR